MCIVLSALDFYLLGTEPAFIAIVQEAADCPEENKTRSSIEDQLTPPLSLRAAVG
tara:strand:+ start:469 stop:633 length:165 start_codon:yes stop_codon:yes gene_type:complete